jgi:hypothetical protein
MQLPFFFDPSALQLFTKNLHSSDFLADRIHGLLSNSHEIKDLRATACDTALL